jgi:hypothetical protein
MKYIQQFLVILSAIAFVFIIQDALTDYSIPIIVILGLFAAIYIAIRWRMKKGKDLFRGSYFEFLAILIIVLLGIFLTGGIDSSLYFLTYFLLFGLTFIFEPIMIFIFMIGLIALFYQQAMTGAVIVNWLRLIPLILISPVGFFFGRELSRREKQFSEDNLQKTQKTQIKK